MRIVIETDGHGDTTVVSFNGEVQRTLRELNVSVHSGRKVKLQMVKEINGKSEFMSYFGDDFKRYDEVNPMKGELNHGE